MKVKKKNPLKHRRAVFGIPNEIYTKLKLGEEVEIPSELAKKYPDAFGLKKDYKPKPVKKEE